MWTRGWCAWRERAGAALILTDSNLARVAELEGVRTLNLNKLATRSRPSRCPASGCRSSWPSRGASRVRRWVISPTARWWSSRDAAEALGASCEVVVKRVIQTHAGRMVFAALPTQPTRVGARAVSAGCVLLAAGRSARMGGGDKLLAPLADAPSSPTRSPRSPPATRSRRS